MSDNFVCDNCGGSLNCPDGFIAGSNGGKWHRQCAPMTQPNEALKPQSVSISIELYRFLMGEGSLDGVWFGDDPLPKVKGGAFWWRKALRRCASRTPSSEDLDRARNADAPKNQQPQGEKQ